MNVTMPTHTVHAAVTGHRNAIIILKTVDDSLTTHVVNITPDKVTASLFGVAVYAQQATN